VQVEMESKKEGRRTLVSVPCVFIWNVTHEIKSGKSWRYENRVRFCRMATGEESFLLTHSKNGKRSFNVIFFAVS
jgi:hypothetical protein